MRFWKTAFGTTAVLSVLMITFPAIGAPRASFVTTAIQDATQQVAPCAYHFDATAVTATDFERPFHTLSYRWDFGDVDAGTWSQGAANRDSVTWDKNHDVGAIAGHVYEEPGNYEVTLTVTDPNGVSDQATTMVSCSSPVEQFTAARSFCFADISGNGGGWEGCPTNATRIDTTDFDAAINQTCGAEANAGRWCSFRRGDTFQQDRTVTLRSRGSLPGLVNTFGAGSRPIVRMAGTSRILTMGDKWTFAGFDVRGDSSCTTRGSCEFAAGVSAEGATIYDVRVDNVLRCFGQGIHAPDRTALVDFDCTMNPRSDGKAPSSVYLSGPRILFMGNQIDGNYIPGGEFNLRYSSSTDAGTNSDKTLIAHSRFRRAPGQRNPLQIRGEHRYLQIHDNFISTRNAREFIEVCERPGGCNSPDSNTRDMMFEMNFATIESGATDGQQTLLAFMASDWTARNNILDLQGVSISGGRLAICEHRSGFGINVNGACLNNTVYTTASGSDAIEIFRGCGIGSGHQVKGNLVHAPNLSGNQLVAGSGCEVEGNLFTSSSPFESRPSSQSQSRPSDFKIRNAPSFIGAGPDYTRMNDHFVAIDAFRGCRTRASSWTWDIGAHQYAADSCGAGDVSGSTVSVAAPFLLP